MNYKERKQDMKDYQKIYSLREEKHLSILQKNLKALQESGKYPYSFEMPISIQFELTSHCNLKCQHCYNRSGDEDKKTLLSPKDWSLLSQKIVSYGGIFQCILS